MLLDRYLIREISANFFAVASVLTVIFLAYSLTRFMTDAASGLLKAPEVAELTLYKSIIALEVLLPLAFYFGVIVGFGRLNVHNELTAMRACGMRQVDIQRSLLLLGLLVAAVVAALSVSVRPWAYSQLFDLRDQARAASELDRIKPQRFYLYDDEQRSVYVEHADDDGHLDGVFIRTRDGENIEVISAPSGTLDAFVTDKSHRLTLRQASIFRSVDGGRDFYGRFDALVLRLNALQEIDYEYRTKSEATSALMLSRDADDRAELQWRLSTPLSTVLLTLTALTLVNTRPREGRYARVPLAIGIYAIYYNLLGVGRTWVEQQSVANLWWVPALLFVGLASTRLYRSRSRTLA